MDSDVSDGFASFNIERGGIFIAITHRHPGHTVGIVFGILALLIVLAGAAWLYYRRNPNIINVIRRSLHHRV